MAVPVPTIIEPVFVRPPVTVESLLTYTPVPLAALMVPEFVMPPVMVESSTYMPSSAVMVPELVILPLIVEPPLTSMASLAEVMVPELIILPAVTLMTDIEEATVLMLPVLVTRTLSPASNLHWSVEAAEIVVDVAVHESALACVVNKGAVARVAQANAIAILRGFSPDVIILSDIIIEIVRVLIIRQDNSIIKNKCINNKTGWKHNKR
jgi:hypothetical protein